MQIFLRHIVLSLDQPVIIAREKDANTLTVILGLDDESLRALAVELILEAFGIARQNPGLREEVVLVR